jgi:hypothetical protein
MNDIQERIITPAEENTVPETPAACVATQETPGQHSSTVPQVETPGAPEGENRADGNGSDGAQSRRWHAEAGRKGAHRIQQLIQEGKLYEQEHGLKRGRQRRRQLLEMGKLYEQEHGLRPDLQEKRGRRLSRMERDELLATFLQCLLRIAKPSFRTELERLIKALPEDNGRQAG